MKALKIMIVAGVMALAPAQATAGDYEVQNVMDDALYGAGVGALVGLGLMLVSDAPTNNWNYLSRGAGIGILAGAAFGVYRSSKSLAQIENGEINLGMPSPQLAFQDVQGTPNLVVTTDLISGTF